MENLIVVTNKTDCLVSIVNIYSNNPLSPLTLKPKESIQIQISELVKDWKNRLINVSSISFKFGKLEKTDNTDKPVKPKNIEIPENETIDSPVLEDEMLDENLVKEADTLMEDSKPSRKTGGRGSRGGKNKPTTPVDN